MTQSGEYCTIPLNLIYLMVIRMFK